ncbi:MAG: sulfatase [Acidobacteriota bacterium]
MSLGLLAIFVLAKVALVWGHSAGGRGWSLEAFFWQDVLVALAFALFQWCLNRTGASPRIATVSYWALVLYAAASIPAERTLSTPMTWPMLRAARGPLADSVLTYATATNIGLVALALALAIFIPRITRQLPTKWGYLAAAGALPIVLLGPFAANRVDTLGMDRNAVTALASTSLPGVSANARDRDWRTSIYNTSSVEDLSRFSGKAKGMNVVMVSLESTAAQYLSLYGGKYEVMPNLNALAQRALVFDNAYAVYPESIKGLYSVLCSTFPAFDSQPEQYENLGSPSLPTLLQDAGYQTALFHSGRFDYLGMQSIIQHRGYQTLEDAGDIGGNHQSSFGVDEPATVTRMLAWIDALPRDRKFFLTYLPIAGHHPYATPNGGPFSGPEEIYQYRNALHYGDESIGDLMKGLRARGLEQNTLWVIYGDHGEAFRQHPGNVGHTFFIYEENVHVPLLIASPRLMPTQERVHKVVSLVDASPTILDLMGLPAQPKFQGRTLLDRSPRMALFFTDYSLGLLGLRDGPWKFVYETASGRAKLFNLTQDPHEIADVAPSNAARVRWYEGIVRGWSRSQQSYIAHASRP